MVLYKSRKELMNSYEKYEKYKNFSMSSVKVNI